VALSIIGSSAGLGVAQEPASAQEIAALTPPVSNQSIQLPSNQTILMQPVDDVVFQGDSIAVFSLMDPYDQDLWQAIQSYISGGYVLRTVLYYEATHDNNILKQDRAFVILEKQ
jgi:hypothetical protein